MGEKLRKIERVDGKPSDEYWFFCPGCDGPHWIRVNSSESPSWSLTGTTENPTISPSILVRWDEGEERKPCVCHSFIREGRIEYLSDCTHAMASNTVDIPDWSGATDGF
jgi:hypothetical protein